MGREDRPLDVPGANLRRTTNPSATVPSAGRDFSPCWPCCVWTATAAAWRLCSRSLRSSAQTALRHANAYADAEPDRLADQARVSVCSIATEIGLGVQGCASPTTGGPAANSASPPTRVAHATRTGRRGSRWRAGRHRTSGAGVAKVEQSTPAQGRERSPAWSA